MIPTPDECGLTCPTGSENAICGCFGPMNCIRTIESLKSMSAEELDTWITDVQSWKRILGINEFKRRHLHDPTPNLSRSRSTCTTLQKS